MNLKMKANNLSYFCKFDRLGPLACSDSELTSETMSQFGHLCRTPWMGDQPIVRPSSSEDDTIQKDVGMIHSRAGFEVTIPVFERSETIERAATGTGYFESELFEYVYSNDLCNIGCKNPVKYDRPI